jgi:tetratricopeptide (TPR) repeat protein
MATTFADYLKMYRESWLRLQKTTPGLLSYEDRALYSTWDISYTQVEQQNTTSARLLRLWAYFGNEDLWFELLLSGRRRAPKWFRELTGDALSFTEAVRVLCDYGLVEADTSSNEQGTESRGYGMHGCVHAWTVHVLNEARNIEMAQLAMRCVARHVPMKTEREYWVRQRRLMQHADRCLKMMMDEISIVEGKEWILHRLGYLYAGQGRLSDAEAMFERALRGYEKAIGPEHTSTLETVNSLGVLYENQGRLSDAEAMYERALCGKEKVLGLEHASTLGVVNNLGDLYKNQGRLSKAEAMLERALRGYEKELGLEHISTLQTVNNLGNLYEDQGRLSEAKAMLERALRGYEKELGLEHTSTLETVNNLGILYKNQGQLSDAEAMFERALYGKEKVLGLEHTSTLNTVNNLGIIYENQGRLSEAEAMYERALRGYEKAQGLERVNLYAPALRTIFNLALLQAQLGNTTEAWVLFLRYQGGVKAVFGVEHKLYQEVTEVLAELDTQ